MIGFRGAFFLAIIAISAILAGEVYLAATFNEPTLWACVAFTAVMAHYIVGTAIASFE